MSDGENTKNEKPGRYTIKMCQNFQKQFLCHLMPVKVGRRVKLSSHLRKSSQRKVRCSLLIHYSQHIKRSRDINKECQIVFRNDSGDEG